MGTSFFEIPSYQNDMELFIVRLHIVQNVFHNTCYVPTRRYYRRNLKTCCASLAQLRDRALI